MEPYTGYRSKLKTFAFVLLLMLVISFLTLKFLEKTPIADKVAVVPIYGKITLSQTSPLEIKAPISISILDSLEEIKKDDSIKAVLIEIDSPGGTVVASEEIMNAVKNLNKPTIALIREIGTSGAYWIASACDVIVASPVSITGSIGVTSSYLEFSDLFEKYGVGYERLVSGEYKDIGSPFKKLTDKEKLLLEQKILKLHDYFVESVANNRNLPKQDIEKIATGEFFLGEEALNLKLIDKLGDKNTAIEVIKEKTGIKKPNLIKYEKEKGLFSLFTKTSSYYIGKGIASELTKEKTISFDA